MSGTSDDRRPPALTISVTGRCECEHASHFDDGDGIGHVYGEEAHLTGLETVWGTFRVCPTCLDLGHMTDRSLDGWAKP